MKYLTILFTALLLALMACKDESACGEQPNELGTFSLLASSKMDFPYEKGMRAVVFLDSLGSQIEYLIEKDTVRFIPFTFNSQCSANPNFYPLYTISQEYRIVEIYNGFHKRRFRMLLHTDLNRDFADQAQVADYITVGPNNDGRAVIAWKGDLQIVVDPRNDPDAETSATHFYPELELNGRTFKEVYEQQMEDPDAPGRFYFNLEYGLIGFTDNKGEQLFSFDRIAQ